MGKKNNCQSIDFHFISNNVAARFYSIAHEMQLHESFNILHNDAFILINHTGGGVVFFNHSVISININGLF